MLVNKRLLPGVAVVALGLVLGGCVGSQKLSPDKVVLDWKDFYPSDLTVFDSCNTFKTNLKDIEYQNKLCFEDKSSLPGDRFYLRAQVTQYDQHSKTWKNLLPSISNSRDKLISELLYQQSRTVCLGNFQTVGAYGFRCTPVKNNDSDILVVSDYRLERSGKLVEASVAVSVNRNRPISENTSSYKTAININTEALKKFLN